MIRYVFKAVLISFIFTLAFSFNLHAEKIIRLENLVAVLDIELSPDLNKKLKVPFTQAVIDELVKAGRYKVIDRANRDAILKEQGFQVSDCVSEECRVKAGRLLGVGKLVVDSVYKIDVNSCFVMLQMVNVETGEIEGSEKGYYACSAKAVIEGLGEVTRRLVGAGGFEEGRAERKAEEKEIKVTKGYGRVFLESEPSGCEIWVDGK